MNDYEPSRESEGIGKYICPPNPEVIAAVLKAKAGEFEDKLKSLRNIIKSRGPRRRVLYQNI